MPPACTVELVCLLFMRMHHRVTHSKCESRCTWHHLCTLLKGYCSLGVNIYSCIMEDDTGLGPCNVPSLWVNCSSSCQLTAGNQHAKAAATMWCSTPQPGASCHKIAECSQVQDARLVGVGGAAQRLWQFVWHVVAVVPAEMGPHLCCDISSRPSQVVTKPHALLCMLTPLTCIQLC